MFVTTSPETPASATWLIMINPRWIGTEYGRDTHAMHLFNVVCRLDYLRSEQKHQGVGRIYGRGEGSSVPGLVPATSHSRFEGLLYPSW
jgi:hypothetical protein